MALFLLSHFSSSFSRIPPPSSHHFHLCSLDRGTNVHFFLLFLSSPFIGKRILHTLHSLHSWKALLVLNVAWAPSAIPLGSLKEKLLRFYFSMLTCWLLLQVARICSNFLYILCLLNFQFAAAVAVFATAAVADLMSSKLHHSAAKNLLSTLALRAATLNVKLASCVVPYTTFT